MIESFSTINNYDISKIKAKDNIETSRIFNFIL